MILEKSHKSQSLEKLPWVLKITEGGQPLGWIKYDRSAYLYAKNKVSYSLGQVAITLYGGKNAITGEQSILNMDTIIAVKEKFKSKKNRKFKEHPSLCNELLFKRDKNLCAYCGTVHKERDLTRDHIIPVSKGGPDTWMNCITACGSCNRHKDNKTPEQADMKLLFVPYVPCYAESLILENRKILADQMLFLLKGVPDHSRLHQ